MLNLCFSTLCLMLSNDRISPLFLGPYSGAIEIISLTVTVSHLVINVIRVTDSWTKIFFLCSDRDNDVCAKMSLAHDATYVPTCLLDLLLNIWLLFAQETGVFFHLLAFEMGAMCHQQPMHRREHWIGQQVDVSKHLIRNKVLTSNPSNFRFTWHLKHRKKSNLHAKFHPYHFSRFCVFYGTLLDGA